METEKFVKINALIDDLISNISYIAGLFLGGVIGESLALDAGKKSVFLHYLCKWEFLDEDDGLFAISKGTMKSLVQALQELGDVYTSSIASIDESSNQLYSQSLQFDKKTNIGKNESYDYYRNYSREMVNLAEQIKQFRIWFLGKSLSCG